MSFKLKKKNHFFDTYVLSKFNLRYVLLLKENWFLCFCSLNLYWNCIGTSYLRFISFPVQIFFALWTFCVFFFSFFNSCFKVIFYLDDTLILLVVFIRECVCVNLYILIFLNYFLCTIFSMVKKLRHFAILISYFFFLIKTIRVEERIRVINTSLKLLLYTIGLILYLKM